jgi:putative endopeptidase
MLRNLIVLFLSMILIISCDQKQLKSGIDKANFDTSVKPQDDFYRYVNGTWLKTFEIPADKSNYGAFTKLYDEAQVNLRKIIEESAAANAAEGTEEQKVGDFYASYMDSTLIEKLGLEPLKGEIQRIESVKSKNDLQKLMSHFQTIGISVPFFYFINQDQKQSDKYIGYLYQSGINLPDRDYYFKQDDKFKEIRHKYIKYIEDLLSLAGIENAVQKANTIMDLETQIAKAHWTNVENRDRDKTYNKYKTVDFEKETSNFKWQEYLSDAMIKENNEIVVYQPSYFKVLGKLFKSESLDTWKIYFTYYLLSDLAPRLNKDFVDLNFEFFSKTLNGIEKNRPRWKRAVSATEGSLGEVVGQVYVKKHFKPEAKARMVELVENLRKAYKARIEQLEWMSPETKKEALVKLSKFKAKIGYPDKWKDYSKLVVKKDDLIGNTFRSNRAEYDREIAKLGKPIDRDEWFMTPQTVNAYYNPPMNEVVFPAAILQPPFFNMEADDAVNYGAIGAVIGHEMTHGFDDQGRKSDGEGNLRDWWTEEDANRFMERAQVMIDQYDGYVPVDTLHVNGKLTLGENIADFGGMTISYNAYKMSLNGKESPKIDGFTGEQRFFIGNAQIWARLFRDEALRQRVLTDPHSPSEYRCNGIVSNMPEFYAAFDVKETDPMYRPEDIRVKIW